jgi:hypothetical protein
MHKEERQKMMVYEIIGGLVVLALLWLGVWKFSELIKVRRKRNG